MKCSCLAVVLVYANRRTANCVALAISLLTKWLMIYVPADVMPASVLAKLKRQRKRKCQRKIKTKMILKTKKSTGES